MFSNNSMSAADYAALSNNGGFGDGSSWFLWIIIILALFGGNWGNNGGTAENYTLASDFATLQRQIDSASSDLKSSSVSIGNGISSLGYDQLSQFNGINSNIASSTYDLSTQINNLASNQQSGFCSTNNNITSGFANVNYNLATQSCNTRQTINDAMNTIVNNDNANYRALNDRITNFEMNAKDEKIADLQAQVSALNLAASQQAQNAYLISQLQPTSCCGCV